MTVRSIGRWASTNQDSCPPPSTTNRRAAGVWKGAIHEEKCQTVRHVNDPGGSAAGARRAPDLSVARRRLAGAGLPSAHHESRAIRQPVGHSRGKRQPGADVRAAYCPSGGADQAPELEIAAAGSPGSQYGEIGGGLITPIPRGIVGIVAAPPQEQYGE